MTKIQRYEIDVDDSEFGSRDVVGVPSVFGDWVKWDDVKDLIKDAERYRWLRDSQRLVEASSDEGAGDPAWFIGENSSVRWGVAEKDADSAIDAAMTKDGA